MSGRNKKRPVIGILTGSFNSDYPRTLITELYKELKDEDFDIRLYTGIEATLFFGNYASFDVGFDRHWLSVFEYSNFEDIDLLVVAYGNIMASHPHIDEEIFLPKLPQVPTIMIGNSTVKPDAYYIMIDNYLGMKSNVDHLIEEHNYKDIAFISGPKGSPSADLRMEAYLDSLEEHGMPVRDELIVYGNYSNNVDSIVETLFERNSRIDAIVSSNDEMCNAVYRVAAKRGRKIGVDLAVVGFDDEEYSAEMEPPLTTVKQDYTLVAKSLAGMFRDFCSGKELSSLRIPASCVRRSSCGCSYETVSMRVPGKININPMRYMTHDEQHKTFQRNIISALVLRNLLTESISEAAFFLKLAQEMRDVGSKSSYILMLDEPVRLREGEELVLPQSARMCMRQNGELCEGFDRKEAPVVSRKNVSEHVLETDKARNTTTFLLFYGEYQYGVLSVEIEPQDVLYFYSMSLQVGSGLRYLELALRQKEVNELLEHQNELLDYTASHDKMTGLYNRMGFMEQYTRFMQQYDSEKRFILMIADVDHLKQINDTFGHSAGDEAICKAADILKKSLPKESLVGRIGGDEYMILIAADTKTDCSKVSSDISKCCESFNLDSGLPYYLGISSGSISFRYVNEIEFTAISRKADERLYDAKRHRRDSVIR